MNTFLNGLKDTANLTYTENGAITRRSTGSNLLNLFSLGGAYRSRSDEDVILLFKKVYEEDAVYALKCLFYLRDIVEGQGERRFFRVCMKWLADAHPEVVKRNLEYIPTYGRWDDLYCLFGTKVENDMLALIKKQLAQDMADYQAGPKTAISLLPKWLPSINTSSAETVALAQKIRTYLGMTNKQYRKTLSALRERINVLECLMSANKWDEIDFSKIPSKAGLLYRRAFMRHDVDRGDAQSYADFAKDDTKTVNAKALYPYEVVDKAMRIMGYNYGWGGYGKQVSLDNTDRLMVNKYWDNLADYFQSAVFNGMAIVDTSGSMYGTSSSAPINVAMSLGLYCAEKAKGPFANHFMTFSSNPTFVKVEGVDFCDKVSRMYRADWGGSTNIEAAFDLMLKTAIENHCSQDELPADLIVISDMEFNSCVTSGPIVQNRWDYYKNIPDETLFESMKKKWAAHGYQMPRLTFWNVNARQDNIPMKDDGYVRYVSGMSPVLFEQVMKDLTAWDLMMDKLDSDRYAVIC